jgi:undecaprenyl-diphosphatase
MNIFQAIVLGIVQGLTEFLPISSSAHLRIVPALLGWGDPGAAFTAIIQIGTLVAVLLYFSKDIVSITGALVSGVLKGDFFGTEEATIGWMIAAGTIPIVIVGLLFRHQIETALRSMYWICASMILLALALILAERHLSNRARHGLPSKSIHEIGWKEAIVIGLSQLLALIPGSSRSGTTITGGLFMNLDRETAARFSFLLSLPAVFAAGLFELYQNRQEIMASSNSMLDLAVATLAAFIVGYFTIAFLLNYLRKHTTSVFIVYRLLLGSSLLLLLVTGKLLP